MPWHTSTHLALPHQVAPGAVLGSVWAVRGQCPSLLGWGAGFGVRQELWEGKHEGSARALQKRCGFGDWVTQRKWRVMWWD